LAKQGKEALEVFKKTADEKNSSLFYFPVTSEISDLKITPEGTDFTFSFKKSLFPAPLSISIPVPGRVQAENAALAIAAVKTAFPQIGEGAVRQGLKNLKIPARFEQIAPEFIIDGAHTPESLALAIETFCLLYGEGGVLVFGCAADKDAAAMARTAYSHFAKIIITTPGTFKASNPSQVYEAFAAQAGREKTKLIADTREAVLTAQKFAAEKNLPVLGTGSFYLVSEIRKIILP
jgi:dihydrofolate synthase/folylpolyglutamate synthase